MIIAIDGATRRPNTPTCVSLGVAITKHPSKNMYTHISRLEHASTSQRGELHGLMYALAMCIKANMEFGEEEFYLITDSEYIYNALSKEWYKSWANNDWLKADGTELTHKEAWQQIHAYIISLEACSIELLPYHVKGHVVSVGKATAKRLIEEDDSLMALRRFIDTKYITDTMKKPEKLDNAKKVFEANHSFLPPIEVFREMIIMNTLVDTVAGYLIDDADKASIR